MTENLAEIKVRGCKTHFKIDIGRCVLCAAEFAIESGYHELGVCCACVKRLANEYWLSHAGEPHPDFDPDGYRESRAKLPKKKQKSVIPQRLRWSVLERDEFRCKRCGTHKDLRADHIVPESKGGATKFDNLQTLCAPCNSRKGVRHE